VHLFVPSEKKAFKLQASVTSDKSFTYAKEKGITQINPTHPDAKSQLAPQYVERMQCKCMDFNTAIEKDEMGQRRYAILSNSMCFRSILNWCTGTPFQLIRLLIIIVTTHSTTEMPNSRFNVFSSVALKMPTQIRNTMIATNSLSYIKLLRHSSTS
jgi:hypothetical protein